MFTHCQSSPNFCTTSAQQVTAKTMSTSRASVMIQKVSDVPGKSGKGKGKNEQQKS